MEIRTNGLPPRYAVRDYFRTRAKSAGELWRVTATEFSVRMIERYSRGKLASSDIADIADDYRSCLTANGAFGIYESHVSGTRALPQRERRAVSGFFLDPVTLRQPASPGNERYDEQAVLLRSCQAEFKSRKASIGYGTGGLVLPQHLLERIYERTEIDRTALAALVQDEVNDLLLGLGLAEATGAWLVGKTEDGNGYRVTAVPYANGLMIVSSRILFGRPGDGELGFRVSIPSGQFHDAFVNPASIVDSVPADGEMPALMSILIAAGKTYFNLTTLSDAQADYYHSFQVLKDGFEDGLLAALAWQYYAPRFPHEPSFEVKLSSNCERSAERLRGMLRSGWLKPTTGHPISCIMPSEFS